MSAPRYGRWWVEGHEFHLVQRVGPGSWAWHTPDPASWSWRGLAAAGLVLASYTLISDTTISSPFALGMLLVAVGNQFSATSTARYAREHATELLLTCSARGIRILEDDAESTWTWSEVTEFSVPIGSPTRRRLRLSADQERHTWTTRWEDPKATTVLPPAGLDALLLAQGLAFRGNRLTHYTWSRPRP